MSVLSEMQYILANGVDEYQDYIQHYGTKRHSGRYPWGSGEDPYQHDSVDFLSRVETLKKNGWTETPENIMKEFGVNTTTYRMEYSLCKDERRADQVAKVKSWTADGMGPTEIGKKLGISESTVRSLLNSESEFRMKQTRETADFIREQINKKGMVDVGSDVARELGISPEKLNTALYILEGEGYPVYSGGIPQATNKGQQTTQRVICPKGTEHKEIYDYANVHALNEDNYTSRDNGKTFVKFQYPKSMDSSRLMIRYPDDVGPDGATGAEKDGIIELRRGVDDLSLGDAKYSQVRILVDDKYYLKGMAVYSDNIPKGYDVVFNSSKPKSKGMEGSLKAIKNDPENPFGSLIKADGQSTYIDKNGKEQLSLINKRADEGDWSDWKNAVPSQFLGKQSLALAEKQLNIAKADKQAEFQEICSLTNPTIKKHFLKKFADSCDSAAVQLQAAALPGQKYHVVIPINSLKDNEVFAPNYENGTKLALIRYPHGGIFELPILTVNNKNKDALNILGKDAIDAVGINHNVAMQLSGADFDGDTVMCIPTHDRAGKVKINNRKPLDGLIGFEPKDAYGFDKREIDKNGNEHLYDINGKEFRRMKDTQKQMGVISNLITDMTLAGADDDELARAVRHSMVVVDAEKHGLDWKQSEKDNNIKELREKYQIKINEDGSIKYGGASTLLSRSKGQYTVERRQGTPKINMKGSPDYDPTRPEGALIYKNAPNNDYSYEKINKRTGETIIVNKTRGQQSTNMAEVDDAMKLVSPAKHPMEMKYAEYANNMKSLANQARKEYMITPNLKYNPEAKKEYAKEVAELNDELKIAMMNSTKEREAQRRAAVDIKDKKISDPDISNKDLGKASQQAITKYRNEVGSVSRKEREIKITDRQWEAIQNGAVSNKKLVDILNNADIDKLRERATPRDSRGMTDAQIMRIKAMSGTYTIAEIASRLGVSSSTVSKYLRA